MVSEMSLETSWSMPGPVNLEGTCFNGHWQGVHEMHNDNDPVNVQDARRKIAMWGMIQD
jgi:hypothetical protein